MPPSAGGSRAPMWPWGWSLPWLAPRRGSPAAARLAPQSPRELAPVLLAEECLESPSGSLEPLKQKARRVPTRGQPAPKPGRRQRHELRRQR